MEGTLQAQKSHQQRVGILKNVMPTFIIFRDTRYLGITQIFFKIKLAQFSIKPTTSGFYLTLKAHLEKFTSVFWSTFHSWMSHLEKTNTCYIGLEGILHLMPCETRSKHGIYILFHI